MQNLTITGIGGVPRAEGIRTSLLYKLENSEKLFSENERAQSAQNLLEAFVQEVRAQIGAHIQPEDAEELTRVATKLAASLI